MVTTTWVQKSGMTSPTDTDNLESSAEQAEASKDAAAVSEAAAAASAAAAAASEVEAESAEANAATSATTATTGAATATTKASEAAASATSASTSATGAQTARTAAEAAETAAAASETASAASAAAASTSETNAASSASAASTSATNAGTSETNAASSASAAATSETNAAASETAASASETNAAASETAAATSESNAASSASAASTSASNAATSESNAASSASAASTSETNAATSASNASTSETNAASSASAAATSASEAAASAASINPDSIDINGGTIDGTVIGGTTPAAGSFTTGQFTGNVSFGDNDKAIFGAGSDLQIYCDGTHSYVDEVGSGTLLIRTNGTSMRLYDTANSADMIRAYTGGSVRIFNDGDQKLATTSTGIDVTGTVTADGLTVDGNASFSAAAVNIDLIETNVVDENTRFRQNAGNLDIQTVDDSSSFEATRLRVDHSTGDISFYEDTGTTPKFFWDASAESLGIGTSSPASLLDVTSTATSVYSATSGTQNISAITVVNDAGAGQTSTLYFKASGNGGTSNARGYINLIQPALNNAADFAFQLRDINGNIGEKVRITSTGNVGIGTTSPKVQLETFGAAQTYNFSAGTDPLANFAIINDNVNSGTGPAIILGSTYSGSSTVANARIFAERQSTGSTNAGATDLIFEVGQASGSALAERMRIDSSGNVGIGTSSPDEKLEVYQGNIKLGTDSNTTSKLIFERAAGDRAEIYVGSSYQLQFDVGGSERLRIDSSGNVGIGTSSPTGKLSIASGTYNTATPLATADDIVISGDRSLGMSFITASAGSSNQTIAFGDSNNTDIGMIRYAHANNSMQFTTNTAEAMRIDSSGNVGIGTSSPAYKVSVGGAGDKIGFSSGSNYGYFEPYDVSGNMNFMLNWGGGSTEAITFGTSTVERMRIDSSGNLLVGTTTTRGASAPVVADGGIAIVDSGGRGISQEIVKGATGSFTTITVSFDGTSGSSSLIVEILMTGYSGKYLDYVAGIYGSQADVVMRDNSDAATSVALSGAAGSSWTATITTNVSHPVVKVKATAGGLASAFTNAPTITFA